MKRIMLLLTLVFPTLLWGQGTLSLLNNMHQVQKGETIESIARLYGITEVQLRHSNPDLKGNKLKKGSLLAIPTPKEETVVEATTETVVETTAFSARLHLDTVKVAVLLPFEEQTERASKLVEFYQGMLMAADSVRTQGTSVEIFAYHSGSTEAQLQELLEGKDFSQIDLVVGPVDQEQIPLLADYCARQNLRLVVPFNAPNNSVSGHPLQYNLTAGHTLLQQEASLLLGKKYANRNYVILDSGQADERGAGMCNTLATELARWGAQMRKLDINGDDFALESALNQFRDNCIIPDNVSIRTLNTFFARIKAFSETHPQYKITMQGYPEWQTYTGTLLPQFYAYDTFIYSAYYRNPLATSTTAFEQRYAANFGHPMQVSFPRYATMGFDMAYYFLHGLATYGDTFEQKQDQMTLSPFQNPIRFVRETENDGFINRAVMLIHYTPDQTIQIVQ